MSEGVDKARAWNAVIAARADERAKIVAWLLKGGIPPARIHTWRDRIFYAWWGLRNPNVSFAASRIAHARAIERGGHRAIRNLSAGGVIMTEDEWKARFKARFESRMGLECGPEFLESAMLFNGTDDGPEDCADDEIEHWMEG